MRILPSGAVAGAALALALVACGSSSSSTSSDAGTTQHGHPGIDSGTPPPPPGDAGATVGYVPGGKAGPGTTVSGCSIFPADNAWNVEVDGADVPLTTKYTLPQGTHLHPDFGGWTPAGNGEPYGIPFNVVAANAADAPTTFGCYADESDPGPAGWTMSPAPGSICPSSNGGVLGVTAYPFFTGMKIEGNYPANSGQVGSLPGDAHALVLQPGASGCTVWEAWNCQNTPSPFTCAKGAKWDLGSNALRTL